MVMMVVMLLVRMVMMVIVVMMMVMTIMVAIVVVHVVVIVVMRIIVIVAHLQSNRLLWFRHDLWAREVTKILDGITNRLTISIMTVLGMIVDMGVVVFVFVVVWRRLLRRSQGKAS